MGLVHNAKYAAIGALISLAFMVPALYQSGHFEPVPYSRVSLERVAVQGDQITIFAAFIDEGTCTEDALEAVAFRLGLPEIVPWVRLLPGDPAARSAGENTLAIVVTADPDTYESLQIRKRYVCDGKKVDKIFLTLREIENRVFPNLKGIL